MERTSSHPGGGSVSGRVDCIYDDVVFSHDSGWECYRRGDGYSYAWKLINRDHSSSGREESLSDHTEMKDNQDGGACENLHHSVSYQNGSQEI